MTGTDDKEKRFAILIDAENISAQYIKTVLDEVSNKGVATYKRIYADWTKTQNNPWKAVLLDYSLTPMQQYSYTSGKNATDSAMIIDAMDILYSGRVEGFCLVTSDSDFTKLASRLREAGMTVVGMGEAKTPRPFVAACNEFKFLDKITRSTEDAAVETQTVTAEPESKPQQRMIPPAPRGAAPVSPRSPSVPASPALPVSPVPAVAPAVPSPAPTGKGETSVTNIYTIRATVADLIRDNSDEEGWLSVSDVGNFLAKRYADFDVRNYGFSKIAQLLESFHIFEMERRISSENKKNPNARILYVRLLPGSVRGLNRTGNQGSDHSKEGSAGQDAEEGTAFAPVGNHKNRRHHHGGRKENTPTEN